MKLYSLQVKFYNLLLSVDFSGGFCINEGSCTEQVYLELVKSSQEHVGCEQHKLVGGAYTICGEIATVDRLLK